MHACLRSLSLRALLALVLTLPVVAQAAPVTILSGQTMLFNIDMGSATPAPPYTRLELSFGIDLLASNAIEGAVQFFAGLDGIDAFTGQQVAAIGGLAGLLISAPDAGFVDGLFSFTMQALGGDLTMDAKVQGVLLTERGELRTDFFEPVGRLVDSTAPGSVPEPSTVALVLLAAAAMAIRGQRAGQRRSAQPVALTE